MTHRYRVVDSKVRNARCEINVAEHCNLSCRGCSHLSPVVPKYFVDPEEVAADLATLGRHYHVDQVRLLGGEPLLHPDLPAVIAAVRASGICERVCLVTNGLLLARAGGDVFEGVDDVELSLYPGRSPSASQLSRIEDLARRHSVDLAPVRVDSFRQSYTEVANDDADLVERIYSSCKIVHSWRCHTVAHGTFFRCPQSYFLPKVLGQRLGGDPYGDGLAIADDEGFGQRLLDYLGSDEPPASCTHCLGTAGGLVAHVQIRRDRFRSAQEQPAREMVAARQLHPVAARRGRKPLLPAYRRLGRALRHLRPGPGRRVSG